MNCWDETFLIAELSDSIHALLYRRMSNLKIEMKMFYELNANLQQTWQVDFYRR